MANPKIKWEGGIGLCDVNEASVVSERIGDRLGGAKVLPYPSVRKLEKTLQCLYYRCPGMELGIYSFQLR